MLRTMKIVLILSVAVFGLVGAFGNINDWAGTKGAVAATTSMATFEGGASWRATSNPAVILTGAVLIPLFKTIGAFLCRWRPCRTDCLRCHFPVGHCCLPQLAQDAPIVVRSPL